MKFPRPPKPMLAKVGPQFLNKEGWITERKYDGFRAIPIKQGNVVRLFSRSGKEYTQKFPFIVNDLRSLEGNWILDGEIAYLNSKGDDILSEVQKRIQIKNPIDIKKYSVSIPVKFFVFDIISYGSKGKKIQDLSIIERKKILSKMFRNTKRLNFISLIGYTRGADRKKLLAEQKRLKREGVVHKNPQGRYHEDYRSGDWRKQKFFKESDVIIIGYEPGQGRLIGTLGAIYIVNVYNGRYIYRGKIGTGFSDLQRMQIKKILDKIRRPVYRRDEIPELYRTVHGPERERAHWVKPVIVSEIKFFEISKDNRFRHGVFLRLRPDKTASEVGEL